MLFFLTVLFFISILVIQIENEKNNMKAPENRTYDYRWYMLFFWAYMLAVLSQSIRTTLGI